MDRDVRNLVFKRRGSATSFPPGKEFEPRQRKRPKRNLSPRADQWDFSKGKDNDRQAAKNAMLQKKKKAGRCLSQKEF